MILSISHFLYNTKFRSNKVDVASITSLHQKLHTALGQNSLLHWETLLVAASHNLKDITLELISKVVTADLLCQSLIVELTTGTQFTNHVSQNKIEYTKKDSPMFLPRGARNSFKEIDDVEQTRHNPAWHVKRRALKPYKQK